MRYFLLFIYILSFSTFFMCSNSDIAGGGDDFPNSIVGTVVDTSGSPSSYTQVRLVPYDYNPLTGGQLPPYFIDTTDGSGRFRLATTNQGTYSIEAQHLTMGTRALLFGLSVSGETTTVSDITMQVPGTVKLFLPDTVDTAAGYVLVKGTTLLRSLSGAKPVSGNMFTLTIDDMPAAELPGFLYDRLNSPQEPELFSDTVVIAAGDTTAMEAFVYWAQYTKDNSGLPDNNLHEMHSAPDGRMWLATGGGVAVFDGIDWTVYNTTNSNIPSNVVMGLKFDSNNMLWVATDAGMASFDGTDWTVFNSVNSELPTNNCVDVAVDRNDTVWCGMYDGIAKYTGTTWVVYDTSNTGLPSYRVQEIAIDSSGSVWFATYNSILKYDNGSWEIFDTGNSSITSNFVLYGCVDKNDTKWFGYDFGVSRYDNSTWTAYDMNNSIILNTRVTRIFVDVKDHAWIGSQDGLTRFDGTVWKDYMGEQYAPLDGKGVFALTVDGKENVWVGTSGNGVIVFGPTKK